MAVSDMKRFLLGIIIFAAIVVAIDIIAGSGLYYLQSNMAGGRTGAEYYACEEATEEIVIMGSSRASHHYVPELLSRELGMSCFNAGQDGNGIIMQYGRWLMIKERYAPKLLIYDINPDYDLCAGDNMTYIDRLKPFCKHNAVNNYVSSIYPMERLKLLSSMYRFNYKFVEFLFDGVRRGDFLSSAGYIPLGGHIRSEIVDAEPADRQKAIDVDPVKLHYLEQLVMESKRVGTEVVMVVSPSWRGGNYAPEAFDPVRVIAEKYGARFFTYLDSPICDDADCFEDSSHLNDDGAKLFTESLILQLI